MFSFEEWLEGAAVFRQSAGRPLVGLCYAQSLDGSLAYQRGRPFALSSPQSLRITHHLRSLHDGILVGIGTVLADDPQLTVRLVEGRNPQPVILDSGLRTPPQARIMRVEREGLRPWIAAAQPVDPDRRKALEKAGGRVLELPAASTGSVDLAALLRCLAESGINSLMVEGGARVISSFFGQALADFAVITIAPTFVGGLNLTVPIVTTEPVRINQFPTLVETCFDRGGEDLIVWGRIKWPGR